MMIGISLDEGFIESTDQILATRFNEWRGTAKNTINVYHMLTLRTALEVLNPVTLYDAPDQLQISLDRRLIGTPGERLYEYSNADVMLAGEFITRSVGMDIATYMTQRVSDTIGFSGEWWTDTKGNVLSYCCIDATPLNFARFGLLYARNGEWNGTQIVSREWVERSTQPALDGIYAYYWWPLIEGFGAFGLNSQIVAIYPEDDLIVLRFGIYTRMGDGRAVRTASNFHLTIFPSNFSNAEFLNTMTSAVR